MICLAHFPGPAAAQGERAREMGIPLEGESSPLNAITDVSGVAVGHTTLVSGSGIRQVGVGPVRTGVTAVFPRGTADLSPVFAGWFSLNGNGEMTGNPLDRRLRSPALPDHHHQHQQRGDSSRRSDRMGSHPRAWGLQLLSAGRCRDLGWRPQRHLWLSCQEGSRLLRLGLG
jgi:hypothetical protein